MFPATTGAAPMHCYDRARIGLIDRFILSVFRYAAMRGPVILVTGSTDGIGKATAFRLARIGAVVILHGRNREKGRRVQREPEEETGNPHSGLVIADLSRPDQVRQMARGIPDQWPRLDVLINNAGTYQKTRHLTHQGVELTFAVNYLGPFLLTNLLLSHLAPGSRIVTVASSAHFDVDRIDWGNLPGQPQYDPWGAYALSKFCDVIFTFDLARQLEGSGVTANCLHPGVVKTKLSRAAAPGTAELTPDQGAETSVFLATDPGVAGVSGMYFEEKRPVRSSALSYDHTVQDRLWKMAEDLTGMHTG